MEMFRVDTAYLLPIYPDTCRKEPHTGSAFIFFAKNSFLVKSKLEYGGMYTDLTPGRLHEERYRDPACSLSTVRRARAALSCDEKRM
eukprot:1334061-Rhodomonas_salina.1